MYITELLKNEDKISTIWNIIKTVKVNISYK